MTILEKALAHARAGEVRKIEVPEWGDPEERDEAGEVVTPAAPLVIYYTMLTLAELAVVEQYAGPTFSTQAPYIVAMKSCDEKGGRLFKQLDHIALRDEAAPEVVKAIAMAMLGRVSVEAARKN